MNLLDRITMRRCRQVAAVLQEYLDGEIDPGTARTVHDHLEECRRCGLEAGTYRAIKAAIPAAEAHAARIDVDPEAVRRLRRFADELASPSDTSGS